LVIQADPLPRNRAAHITPGRARNDKVATLCELDFDFDLSVDDVVLELIYSVRVAHFAQLDDYDSDVEVGSVLSRSKNSFVLLVEADEHLVRVVLNN
jgi:hypothetical protein